MYLAHFVTCLAPKGTVHSRPDSSSNVMTCGFEPTDLTRNTWNHKGFTFGGFRHFSAKNVAIFKQCYDYFFLQKLLQFE
jgi:hypothetical protein